MALILAATEHGQGPPVVILHGLFGSGRNWGSIARGLAERHRVITLDLRNHGASPAAPSMGYAEMVEDLLAFLAGRGLDRVALLGHSMGGKVAMLIALQHGALVERLVVADVAPVSYPPVLLAYVRAMMAVDLGDAPRRAEVEKRLAPAIPDPAERQFLVQNLTYREGRPEWRLDLPVFERFLPEIAAFPTLPADARYEGAVLFVAGSLSSYVRPEHEPIIRARFPAAVLRYIPEAGHWLHAEQPEAFLRLVEPFLAGRPLPE